MIASMMPTMALSTFAVPDVSTWAKLQAAMAAAGTTETTITLTHDLKATDADLYLSCDTDQNITIDLNGHIIDRGLAELDKTLTDDNKNGTAILVHGTLTIIDGAPETPHAGYIDAEGLWHKSADGHPTGAEEAKTIKGGIITGGIGYRPPDPPDAFFPSTSKRKFGGAIDVFGSCTLVGGTLAGNKVNQSGGGVCVENGGSFTMTGGAICNNTADTGAGIAAMSSFGTVDLKGGIITGNNAKSKAGGVYVATQNAGEGLVLGGTIKVENNHKGTQEQNVYLSSGATAQAGITLDNPLSDMNVGITEERKPADGEPMTILESDEYNLLDFFYYDNDNREMYLEDGKLMLRSSWGIWVSPNIEHATVTVDKQFFSVDGFANKTDAQKTVTISIADVEEGYRIHRSSIYAYYNNGYINKKLEITEIEKGVKYTFIMPPKDVKVDLRLNLGYRSFCRIVCFDMQGHGGTIADMDVAYGSKLTSPAKPKAKGYAFCGWYKDSKCTDAWDFDNDVVRGTMTLYAKWVSTHVAKPTIKKITAGKKSFTIKFKKSKNKTYQLRYSTKKSMKGAKLKSVKTAIKAIKKLKSNQVYYVQARSIKKINGKNYKSGWTKERIIRVK